MSVLGEPGASPGPPERPSKSSLETAADRIRESSKWLLAAFGAVGVVVVAGVALSDLSKVADFWTLGAAAGCMLLALVGVFIAILAAGEVVTKGLVTLDDLVEEQAGKKLDKAFLAGLSVDEFKTKYVDAITIQRNLVDEFYAHLENAGKADTGGESVKQYEQKTILMQTRAAAATRRAAVYTDLLRPLLIHQSYVLVKEAYEHAKRKMAAGALIAAAGVLLFVTLTSTATENSGPVVGDVPVQVVAEIRMGQHARIAELVGDSCDLKKIIGSAIATEGNVTVIAIPGSADCRQQILRLSPEDALIRRKD